RSSKLFLRRYHAQRNTAEEVLMASDRRDRIEIGFQVFIADGGEEVGAVRDVSPDGLVIYVENAGDFRVPLAAVEAVHSQKVILTCAKLSREVRRAIGHAHDAEQPGM